MSCLIIKIYYRNASNRFDYTLNLCKRNDLRLAMGTCYEAYGMLVTDVVTVLNLVMIRDR